MKIDIDEVIAMISSVALVIFGVLCLVGATTNTTLAIVIVGAYIGSNLWIGQKNIAEAILASKK